LPLVFPAGWETVAPFHERAIEAVQGHRRFGFNFDPSHLGYQGVDYVRFIRRFHDRIHNPHIKDVW